MRERAQDCRHACRQPEDGVRFSGFDSGTGICQAVFPKMFNCSEPLKLRTGALPLRFATPGYFQNMNRGRNVAEFDSNAPTVQGGIPMTVNVKKDRLTNTEG